MSTSPQTMPTGERQRPRRPLPVTLLSAYFGVMGVLGLTSLLLALTGRLRVPEPDASYFESVGVFELTLSFAINALSVVLAVVLFRLRTAAIRLLLVLIAITVAADIYAVVVRNFASLASISTLIFLVLGLVTMLVALWYAANLKRRNVLR